MNRESLGWALVVSEAAALWQESLPGLSVETGLVPACQVSVVFVLWPVPPLTLLF